MVWLLEVNYSELMLCLHVCPGMLQKETFESGGLGGMTWNLQRLNERPLLEEWRRLSEADHPVAYVIGG